ncbi:MAG TPA: SCE4755 family polysaccharide monooxygenase-like protein [Polyangiaceae bacterium]|nr:SCE4755 family polysaccharide monooxygenase-like protein [Polyangiaceae bacterium]
MFSVLSRPGVAGVCLVALTLGLALARDAAAHIDLDQPPPREIGSSREPNSDLKQGPCGQVENGRTDRVSVFAPGETIEVTWTETINHRSYYRIAFDRDGDDAFPTFAGPGVGAQGIDPRGLCPVDGQVILAYELTDGARGTHTLRVTLPSVECERCTLQVVQYMFDTNNPYYFQCADLALRRPASEDAGATGPSLDASLVDAATGVEPRAAPGCSARIAPLDAGTRGRGRDDEGEPPPAPSTPPRPAAERSPSEPPPAGVESAAPAASRRSGGCALLPSRGGSHTGAWALLLGLLAMRWSARYRGGAPRASR